MVFMFPKSISSKHMSQLGQLSLQSSKIVLKIFLINWKITFEYTVCL